MIDNPASRINPGVTFFSFQSKQKKINAVATAPIKAQAAVPAKPKMLFSAPRKMDMAAPNVAPEEIPVI